MENDHIGTERVTELETKLKEIQEELEKCVNKLFNSEEENEKPKIEERLKVLEDDHVTKEKFEALKKNTATGNDLRQSLAKLESNVT